MKVLGNSCSEFAIPGGVFISKDHCWVGIDQDGNVKIGSTRVREVLLYQSTLKPSGPAYTVLSRHDLKNLC